MLWSYRWILYKIMRARQCCEYWKILNFFKNELSLQLSPISSEASWIHESEYFKTCLQQSSCCISAQKQPLEVFFIKNSFQHRYFPVKFVKNIYFEEHVWTTASIRWVLNHSAASTKLFRRIKFIFYTPSHTHTYTSFF